MQKQKKNIKQKSSKNKIFSLMQMVFATISVLILGIWLLHTSHLRLVNNAKSQHQSDTILSKSNNLSIEIKSSETSIDRPSQIISNIWHRISNSLRPWPANTRYNLGYKKIDQYKSNEYNLQRIEKQIFIRTQKVILNWRQISKGHFIMKLYTKKPFYNIKRQNIFLNIEKNHSSLLYKKDGAAQVLLNAASSVNMRLKNPRRTLSESDLSKQHGSSLKSLSNVEEQTVSMNARDIGTQTTSIERMRIRPCWANKYNLNCRRTMLKIVKNRALVESIGRALPKMFRDYSSNEQMLISLANTMAAGAHRRAHFDEQFTQLLKATVMARNEEMPHPSNFSLQQGCIHKIGPSNSRIPLDAIPHSFSHSQLDPLMADRAIGSQAERLFSPAGNDQPEESLTPNNPSDNSVHSPRRDGYHRQHTTNSMLLQVLSNLASTSRIKPKSSKPPWNNRSK